MQEKNVRFCLNFNREVYKNVVFFGIRPFNSLKAEAKINISTTLRCKTNGFWVVESPKLLEIVVFNKRMVPRPWPHSLQPPQLQGSQDIVKQNELKAQCDP